MMGSRRSLTNWWRQLSKREQLLTSVALLAVGLVIIVNGVIAPSAKEYEHRVAQLDNLSVGISTLTPYANAVFTVPVIENANFTGSGQQKDKFGQPPPVQSLPVILEKLAAEPNLSLMAIQPENPLASNNDLIPPHRLMTVTVKGDYTALASFFERLTATAIPIRRIAITTKTDKHRSLVGIITFVDNPVEGK